MTAEQREKKREKDRRLRFKKSLAMMTDHDLYAEYRRKKRERAKRYRDKHRRRRYHEIKSMRFPDWATKGLDCVDHSSTFLWNNATPAQKAWAAEFLMQQANKRDKN